MSALLLQLTRFSAVGIAALAAHWLTVATIVPLGALPLAANAIAFAIAFQVSYWGHRRWTFDASGKPHRSALPRFLLTAGASFAINEFLYFLFLRYTALDYRISLLIVLGAVASFTFVLGRQWAFR